ncbi:MAG: hypothetical protein QXP98_07105 [Thermoproteus sp.]
MGGVLFAVVGNPRGYGEVEYVFGGLSRRGRASFKVAAGGSAWRGLWSSRGLAS